MRVGECRRCGACCQYMWLSVLRSHYEQYWKVRGAEGFDRDIDPNRVIIRVYVPCPHYRGGECAIWGQENYPLTCRLFPPEQGPNDMYRMIKRTVGCGYDYR